MGARAGSVLVMTLGFGGAAVACSSSSSPPPPPAQQCPDDLPAACPTPEPSYSKDVAPILEHYCLQCHGPGGVEYAKEDLSTYAAVLARRAEVLSQVNLCNMPPVSGVADAGVEAGAMPLSDAARVTLLGWLVCDAPNN